MDGNEWMSCECSDEGTRAQNIHQKKEIALEVAAKFASVNGSLGRTV
jgi:hypothetical protein